MSMAVDSSFEVVTWFYDRALNSGEYLQPQKLHRLLYLAQAYYAVAHEGERLMPSIFVADPMGPLDPNMYRAFENGRPGVTTLGLPRSIEQFLDVIWRRFGHHSADYLSRMLIDHGAYREAASQGLRAEITLDCMVRHFSARKEEVDRVIGPRLVKSHKGRAVEVRKWSPRVHKPAAGA